MPNLIELMDNPEKVAMAATHILAKHGHEYHRFEEECGNYDIYMTSVYEDIPNKKIYILGRRNMYYEEKMNHSGLKARVSCDKCLFSCTAI